MFRCNFCHQNRLRRVGFLEKTYTTSFLRRVLHRIYSDCALEHYRRRAKVVRRAATMLMAHIVRESIDLGYEGQIVVDAVASSADFYRRMGFIETGYSSVFAPEMVLTPAAARNFLSDIAGE